MNKWAILLGVAMVAGAAQAVTPLLKEGTKEIQLSGNYDPDAIDDYFISVNAGYGQFIVDNLEAGILGGYHGSDRFHVGSVKGFVEYNLDLQSELVPFGRLAAGWIGGEGEDAANVSHSSDSAGASATVGVKYFLTDTVAVSVDGEYTKCSDDVFVDGDGVLQDDNFEFNLGLRFLLP